MEKENTKKKSTNSVITDGKPSYLNNMRNYLYQYLEYPGRTVAKLSEMADLPKTTVENLLYGKTEDCKLSTALAIAKALGVTMEELTQAGTVSEITMQNVITCRNLPQNALYLIRWFINHQATLYRQDKANNKKIISVMCPIHTNDGLFKVSNNFRQVDISHLHDDLKCKVFFGLALKSDLHIEYYNPNDILLIANDRKALPHEHLVVLVGENIFLAKRKTVNGEVGYYGIRDNKFKCDDSGIDEIIGYVTYKIPDTSEIGNR